MNRTLVTQLLMRPLDWISRLAQWGNLRRERRFDQLSGVETSESPEYGCPRGLPADMTPYAIVYQPTQIGLFRRIVRTSRVEPADFGFVDLGSGKGRTLLLASSCGFSPVFGIEVDERLCRISRENVARWTARRAGILPTIIQADARDALFPPGNLFVFMFNPFTGPLFNEVAERLGA